MSKYETFAALHVPGDPLIIFNIWDAGSAKAVAAAGAKAIATGSYGVAEAHGYKDGEAFPFELALTNCREVVSVTELPVSIDMEAGYGSTPEQVARSAAAVAEAGAVGVNLEDRAPGETTLRPLEEAAARVRAVAGAGLWVNARTDVYLGKKPDDYTTAMIDDVITRAQAYADVGAGSLFVPFLGDHPTIAAICERSPLPVNILWAPGRGTKAELAALGVARISYGHGPWAAAMNWLGDKAKAAFAGELSEY
ncbi:isocitrate lyase/phosphoenolpyruvate mutase family protein [Erythrobacter sp. SDW2]|uniref:isocitrate lyase/PEP mutase family protein n=1 Tax=Erythrobacter sp. SDW2 TaxID=2907154 RepID=UPI001F38EC44|nr:isocitrate lyase/phosphoenolpyruvate mutase family protein [Erythrobacter sp. SDW2]UIP07958.1 isocitrate lyase/phosphoenolpyruvate mutase family protein [Erythrobacter sp. SDW2]